MREINELLSAYFKFKDQGYSNKEAEKWAFVYVYREYPKY